MRLEEKVRGISNETFRLSGAKNIFPVGTTPVVTTQNTTVTVIDDRLNETPQMYAFGILHKTYNLSRLSTSDAAL